MELTEDAETSDETALHGTGMSATEHRSRRRRLASAGDPRDAANITKHFGGLTAVNDVSFRVPGAVDRLDHRAQRRRQDDVLQHAHRALQADARDDRLRRARTSPARRPDSITKAGMARTFQNIRLFATMTALENVLVGEHPRMKAGLFGSILRTPRVRREEKRGAREGARELAYVGHPTRLARPAGDQPVLRRPAPGRDRPRARLGPEAAAARRADGGHEPAGVGALTDFMRKLRDERGLTILLIEHDMKVVMGVSERVTVLDHGEKIAEGAPPEVRGRPARHRGLPRQAGLSEGDARWRSSKSRTSTPTTAHPGAQGRLARRRGGRDRDADRLQRRRQVDHAALDLRAHPAAHRADPVRAARRSRSCRRRRSSRLGISQSPEGRQLLPAHDRAREPRARRLPAARRRASSEDLDRVFELFPRLRGARDAEGGHDVRRRAADARHRPGADGRADAAAARRALDGHRADPRRAHLRDDRARSTSRARRSCWSSRTRTSRSTSPSAATCWRPARSCWPTTPPRCGEPRSPEGLPRHMTALRTARRQGAVAPLPLAPVGDRRLATCPSRKGYGERPGLAPACCSTSSA